MFAAPFAFAFVFALAFLLPSFAASPVNETFVTATNDTLPDKFKGAVQLSKHETIVTPGAEELDLWFAVKRGAPLTLNAKSDANGALTVMGKFTLKWAQDNKIELWINESLDMKMPINGEFVKIEFNPAGFRAFGTQVPGNYTLQRVNHNRTHDYVHILLSSTTDKPVKLCFPAEATLLVKEVKASPDSLSAAAIGGISGGVVALIILVVIAVVLIYCVLKKRSAKKREADAAKKANTPSAPAEAKKDKSFMGKNAQMPDHVLSLDFTDIDNQKAENKRKGVKPIWTNISHIGQGSDYTLKNIDNDVFQATENTKKDGEKKESGGGPFA